MMTLGPKLDNFDLDEILWLHSGQWEHLTLSRATGRDIASILYSYKAVTRYKTSSIAEYFRYILFTQLVYLDYNLGVLQHQATTRAP